MICKLKQKIKNIAIRLADLIMFGSKKDRRIKELESVLFEVQKTIKMSDEKDYILQKLDKKIEDVLLKEYEIMDI